MATFKEQFEELFGTYDELAPIQPDELESQAQRRAIDMGGLDPEPRTALPVSSIQPPVERQGAFTGLLKTGGTQLAEGALGALEYGARQLEVTRGTDVEGFLNYGRERLQMYREDIYNRMNPDVIDSKGREFLTLDPDRTIWRGSPLQVGESILYKLTEQIPMTLATLVPGGLMVRAGASAKGISYLGASEAGLSLGFIQNDIADGIAELSDEELVQESPRFAQLLEEYDPETARSQFTAEAQGAAPVIGGLLVGAVSAAAGRYLKPTLTGEVGGSFGQRFRRGAISEGLIQEGPQESLEQIVGNIAAAAYDGDRQALEGAAEAYFQGAAVGGPLGGTFAGMFGRSQEAAPDQTGDDGATPVSPPASFDEVFGTGGRNFDLPDAPDAGQNVIAPAISEDVQAAISANIREDNMMDDMLDPIIDGRTESERAAAGLPTRPRDQGELFPTAAPSTGPGVLVEPEAPTGPPEQSVLPMTLRERGKPSLQENPRGARLPLDIPQVEEPAVQEAEPEFEPERGDIYEVAMRTDDLFQPQPEEVEGTPGVRGTGGRGKFRAEVKTPDGTVLDSKVFGRKGDANRWADQQANTLEGDEVFTTVEEIQGVERTEGRRETVTPPFTPRPYKEAPTEPEGEKAVRKATADLPFEEGAEIRAATRASKTRAEAARKIVKEAGRQLDREREKAISGFFPPDNYDFNDEKNQRRYERLWSQLVDTELGIEMQPRGVAGNRGVLTKRKNKILKDLAKVRQLDKPTRKVEKKVRVAAKVDKSTVRTLRRNAAKIAQQIDTTTEDVLGDMPDMDRAKVDKLKGIDLDVMYEQAVRYLEGQDQRYDSEAARRVRSPSVKRKGILRALNKRRNKAETESRSGDQKLVTPTSRQGISTASLTQVTQKADESREDTIKRKRRAKKTYQVIGGKIATANERLEQMDMERAEDADLTTGGRQELMARSYLSQLIQVAEAVRTAGQTDTASLDFADRIMKALELAAAETDANLASLMKAQQRVMDAAVNLKEGPVKRAAAVFKANKKLQAKINGMERKAKQEKDSIWQTLVGPVMVKLNNAYFARQPYRPTMEEAQGLQWALREWRKDIPKGYREDFYTPTRSALTRFGFEFDSNGNLIVKENEDGRLDYTPSEMALGRFAGLEDKIETPEVEYSPPPTYGQSAEAFNKKRPESRINADEVSMQYDANRHMRGTALLRQFRKVVDNKKTTINRIIDAERRLVADLRKAGLIKSEVGGIVTIDIPGFKNISYRRVESGLSAKTLTKPQARERVQATFRDYYTQEIKRFRDASTEGAADLTGTETMSSKPVNWRARDPKGRPPQKSFGDTTGFWVEDNILELQTEQLERHGDSIEAAGSTLGDMLLDGPSNGQAALAMLVEQLPENSVYGIAARTLAKYGFSDVAVKYAPSSRFGDGTLGLWSPKERAVLINKDLLGTVDRREERAVHAVLHELVHAGTQESIAKNPELKLTLERLRNEARNQFRNSNPGKKLPYGLQLGTPVDEFVAEMFTNPGFQRISKQVQIGPGVQFWEAFKAFVKRVLGWVQNQETTAFEVVMELESELFELADMANPTAPDLRLDMPLSKVASPVWDKMNQSYKIEQRARDMASRFGRGKFLHSLLTMRQLREMYGKYFPQGELGKYMDAFNARNSRNAELMQAPEKLSREWTSLQEKDPDGALEFSRVGTESTLLKVDPTLKFTHERNKSANKEDYQRMKKRYDALSPEFKKMWGKVTKYYADSLKRETNLSLLNAIRGVVTQGGKVNMSQESFERKYNIENIGNFTTAAKIKEEFGEFLGDNEDNLVSTIQQIASVPGLQEGVYFPLTRYGEHAVFVEDKGEKSYYRDSKEANAYAATLRAADPTATVEVKREQDGRYSVRETIREFVTRESAFELEQERERLLKEYPNGRVGDAGLKLELQREAALNSNAALSAVLKTLDNNPAAQNAIKQFYLRSLADSSFRKREISRKRRRGVDFDSQHRNFANYAKQSAYYQAQLEHGWKMGKALSDMRDYLKGRVAAEEDPALSRMTTEELQNVYKNLKMRDEFTTDPQEISALARKGVGLTQFYMLTSASYHIINSSQPWMVTLPTMGAKHGWGSAFSAMKAAQKTIAPTLSQESVASWFGAKTLTSDAAAERVFGVYDTLVSDMRKNNVPRAEEHIAMLDKLRKTHVLEVSPLTELREIAAGDKSFSGKVLDASRVMAHVVEVNNRVLTAIAAYNLELEFQLEKGASREKAVEAATAYAENMVSQTQFDYSTANKPPLFQKYPLLFQFMQWSQHIYAHLVRSTAGALRGDPEARRVLLGVLGTHAAVGGAIGVALQPIKMAFGLAMMALGDDDEPYTLANAMSGKTFDRLVASSTNELFGTTASTVLTRGVPAALGADLSTRMSLGTLYFIDVRPDTPESVAGSLALSFGGAFVNQMGTFYRGTQHLASGDYVKAVESFTPKFFRDIVRAGRLTSDGLVNNQGDTVIDTNDLSFMDVALQAVGFTPTTTTQFYEGQAAIKDVERYVRNRKARLLKDFRTSSDRAAVLREVVEFNRAYPQEAITRSALLRNLQSKTEREGQYQRYGAAIDDRKAPLYRGYGEPYR